MTGKGEHTNYRTDDDWEMVYDIVIPTLSHTNIYWHNIYWHTGTLRCSSILTMPFSDASLEMVEMVLADS